MPYRHAWLYLVALLAGTFVAFWPSYLSKLSEASWGFHAHGITAGLWIAAATVIGLFLLYRANSKHGRPYLEAAGFVALQALLMETLGLWGPWAPLYSNLAHAPVALLTLASVALAAFIAYSGWRAGTRPRAPRPAGAAAQVL